MYIDSLEKAIKDQPEGACCWFCGRLNPHWDDCGYFYIHNENGDYVASCARAPCPPTPTAER